jgi:hypothetical protein
MLVLIFELPLKLLHRAVEGSNGLREAPLVPDDIMHPWKLCSCTLLDSEAVPQYDSGRLSNGWRHELFLTATT